MSGGAFKLGESGKSVYLIAVHLMKDPVDLPSRLKVLGWRLAELDLFHDSSKPASVQKDKRRLTLAVLSLSPLVFYLWLIVARIYVFVEPYLWPVIHSVTVTYTCWRGPFLVYTSPAVAPEMRSVVEQSLKLVSIQILILISTLHCNKPS